MSAATRADPSPSFRFHIEIQGVNVARFSECSGLELEQETFDYKEGGLNSTVHRFPGRFKFTNLTLKKGIAADGKVLWDWMQATVKAVSEGSVTTHNVTVTLYDLSGKTPLRTWELVNAYPVKWSSTALSAEQNAIAMETLVLAHQGMSFAQ
jgi:phage tail-like protein